MNPGSPSLYLDPLLPLALYPQPRSIPDVAGTAPARAILIAQAGGYRVSGDGGLRAVELRAPGLVWRRADEPLRLRSLTGDAGCGGVGTGWLLVVGQRLLDQLIVAAFGEPGFSGFLKGFAKPGSSPSGRFPEDLDEQLAALARELDERPPVYRVRARSLLTDALLSLYRATLTAEPVGLPEGFRMATLIDHIELNYHDHLDLETLAAMMETSPTHLSRVFRSDVEAAQRDVIEELRRLEERGEVVIARSDEAME